MVVISVMFIFIDRGGTDGSVTCAGIVSEGESRTTGEGDSGIRGESIILNVVDEILS